MYLSNMRLRPESIVLKVFHYVAPLATLVYFIAAKAVALCLLQQPTRGASWKRRRIPAVVLLVVVVGTFVGQGLSRLAESKQSRRAVAAQDEIVYIMLSICTYGFFTLSLIDNPRPVWHPYLAVGFVGAAFETVIASIQGSRFDQGNDYASSRFAFQVFRAALLVIYCIVGSSFALLERFIAQHDREESQPLLTDDDNSNGYTALSQADTLFDGDSSDSDDEDAIEARLQRQKRLHESGNWLVYLQDFKIFIPILWPSRDRFVQLCLAVIGVVLVAERVLNVLLPRQLGIIVDELTQTYGSGIFPWHSVGLWILYTYLDSEAGIFLIQNFATLPLSQFTRKSIAMKSFSHIMHLSMDFHNEKNSGELIRAVDQGQNLANLLEFMCFHILPLFIDLGVAFIYVYSLFDIYMSLILVIGGVTYSWLGLKTTAWTVDRRRKFNVANREESKVQVEGVTNWQTVSHFNRAQYECDRYSTSIDQHNKTEIAYYGSYYFGSGLQSFVMFFARLSAFSLAIYRTNQGSVPIGHLVTLSAYWHSIERPLDNVARSIRRISSMLTDAERLLQLLRTQPTIKDAPGAFDIEVKGGQVDFESVDFSYDPRKPILTNLSFTAKPGQTIALVGETGGGKSTILKLLYRYYDVTKGSIRIDGQDLRNITLDSLRDAFGMVPQDPTLFNLTIMENVRYARLDATDEEVKDACRAAAIHDKIESFPDKYQSTVGERGIKLSGGELQRVSIARAILRRPKLVLLDEATSMIDAETEAVIQQAFRRLTADRTTFIIAHRLSTIQHADQILVISDGRIIERGTHDELFRLNGKYVALWSKQLSKEVKEIGNTLHAKEMESSSSSTEVDESD